MKEGGGKRRGKRGGRLVFLACCLVIKVVV